MWNFIQATCLLILPVVIDLPTLSAPNQQFHCSSCNGLLSWLQIIFTQLGEMHSSKTKLVCEMLSKDTFLFPRCLIQKQRLMSPKGPNPSLLFFSPSSTQLMTFSSSLFLGPVKFSNAHVYSNSTQTRRINKYYSSVYFFFNKIKQLKNSFIL